MNLEAKARETAEKIFEQQKQMAIFNSRPGFHGQPESVQSVILSALQETAKECEKCQEKDEVLKPFRMAYCGYELMDEGDKRNFEWKLDGCKLHIDFLQKADKVISSED